MRPCGFPRGRHQDASRSVSTTDVSRHEHPSRLHLRRLAAERRGKTRRRSPSRSPSSWQFATSKATPDHLAVIRPPAAARLTARRWLRVDRQATSGLSLSRGREVASRRQGRGERRGLFSRASLRRVGPSDISVRGSLGGARSTLLLAARALSHQRHVNVHRRSGARRCLPPEETTRAPSRELDVERCPAGRRGFAAARDHRCSLTSTRPLTLPFSRVGSGPRALLRLLQESCLHEHDHGPLEHPGRRGGRSGRLPVSKTGLPDRGQPPNGLEVRGRGTPLLGAPRGDCSPRRLRPNLAPLRAPPVAMVTLSPCPERRGERGTPPSPGTNAGRRERALAGRRQREGRATPRLREEARCSPTRGTFHLEAVRERTAAASDQQSWYGVDASAFFTGRKPRRGTPAWTRTARPTDADEPESWLPSPSSTDRSAPRDFCVRG